jgi:branched-chain amino acid transport system ATP-binding protein
MQFGGVVAVNNLSLEVNKGEIVALIGPNGAGKTTAFNCVTGIYDPTNGKISFNGKTIVENHPRGKMKKLYAGENAKEYVNSRTVDPTPDIVTKLGIARTFQNIRLFGEMNLVENVLVGMDQHFRSGYWSCLLRPPGFWRERERMRRRAFDLLKFVDLADNAADAARSLPYGHQRRLEIARALATRPRLILLDEPAAGMNPAESADLMKLIRRIRESGVTVVLIEHDMKVVMGISDRIAVLQYGRKIAEGTPEEIRNDPVCIAAYLGTEDLG